MAEWTNEKIDKLLSAQRRFFRENRYLHMVDKNHVFKPN